MRDTTLVRLNEKISSKNEYLEKSMRYVCDICGRTHTSLEIYEEGDIILCDRCAYSASYEHEEERPDAPFYITGNSIPNFLENLL